MTPAKRRPRPGDNVRRPGGSRHPHDPRHMGRPPRDDRKPAGDERTDQRSDDVPDIDDKSRAPLPKLPHPGKPQPVD